MLSMIFTFLGSLFTGPFLTAATNVINAHYKAQVDQGKITAEVAIQQAQLDMEKEKLEQATVQSEENRYWPIVRWGFAMPFIIYDWKIIVWDRVLGLGHTDQLLSDQMSLQMIIVAAYFGHSAIVSLKK